MLQKISKGQIGREKCYRKFLKDKLTRENAAENFYRTNWHGKALQKISEKKADGD